MTNTITLKAKRGRPRKISNQVKTDWEKLAKRLQEALESSVRENKALADKHTHMIRVAHEFEKQVVGLEAVIELLESKLDRVNDSI